MDPPLQRWPPDEGTFSSGIHGAFFFLRHYAEWDEFDWIDEDNPGVVQKMVALVVIAVVLYLL